MPFQDQGYVPGSLIPVAGTEEVGGSWSLVGPGAETLGHIQKRGALLLEMCFLFTLLLLCTCLLRLWGIIFWK